MGATQEPIELCPAACTTHSAASNWHPEMKAFTFPPMASMSARPVHAEVPPTAERGDVRPDERTDAHKARVRASLEWALVEFDSTLAKLAK
jgi:hypothetical protein